MAKRHSPSVRRRRLSAELRRLREASGKTSEQVTKELEWSRGRLTHMELNKWVRPDLGNIRDLLDLYGVEDSQQREAILDLARQSRQKGWWTAYDDVFTDSYVGFEAEASKIWTYEPLVVPGLLHTKGYAAALTRANLVNDPAKIERYVTARMERQEVLQRSDPPALWAVIDEAALLRPAGSPDIMRGQVQSLIDYAEANNSITLQVLPLSNGLHPGLSGPFAILDFPESADQPIVYLEMGTNSLYLERDHELDRWRMLFDHVRATALPTDASITLMRDLINTHYQL